MINSERLDQTELKLKCFVNQSLPAHCVCARQSLLPGFGFSEVSSFLNCNKR